MANCTCFVLGDCGVTGTPSPVYRAVGAANWHDYLTNGWTKKDFDKSKVKVGDVIEWTKKPHVARVFKIENEVIYLRGSYYTGQNGYSSKDGKYDTRDKFTSMEEWSNWVVKNYPDRFYNEMSLEKLNAQVGAEPTYILSMPDTIDTVERNEDVNQILTTDTALRIRTAPSLSASIVGHVQIGYYNVLAIEEASSADKKQYKEAHGEDLECWYEIGKDRWCGNVSTEFLPKKSSDDISKAIEIIVKAAKELQEENNRYKEGLKNISDIINELI